MKIKKNDGLAGIDMVIAIIAITIFSTLIISMMHNNVMENVKLKKETLAMIFITEIFENVGIESYDNLIIDAYEDITNNEYNEHIEGLIPQDLPLDYKVRINITDNLIGVGNNEGVLKKIELTLTYEIGNKTFNSTVQRMKIKE